MRQPCRTHFLCTARRLVLLVGVGGWDPQGFSCGPGVAWPSARPAVGALGAVRDCLTMPSADSDQDSRKGLGRSLLHWVAGATIGVVAGVVLRTFVVGMFVVQGTSMEPTLVGGDMMVVDRVTYLVSTPVRGDVVVLHEVSGMPGKDLVKRVIGLPGEVVEGRGCAVIVDGMVLSEPYAVHDGSCGGGFPPISIPPGHVWVLGDNRPVSMDSRVFGPVPFDEVVGKVLSVVWPPDDWESF